jgi:hypothetical protein
LNDNLPGTSGFVESCEEDSILDRSHASDIGEEWGQLAVAGCDHKQQ